MYLKNVNLFPLLCCIFEFIYKNLIYKICFDLREKWIHKLKLTWNSETKVSSQVYWNYNDCKTNTNAASITSTADPSTYWR